MLCANGLHHHDGTWTGPKRERCPECYRERRKRTQARYQTTAKGKATGARYNESAPGRERTVRYCNNLPFLVYAARLLSDRRRKALQRIANRRAHG